MNNDSKIDIDDVPDTNPDDQLEWHTCCSKSSVNFIKYIVTVVMSIIILLFCIIMIIGSEDGADNSIYFSLISSILTLYVPSPTLESLKK